MKIKDGIVGFVVGDALGVPVEFESRNKLKDSPVTEMIGYGTYHQPKGTFSDDSSMILATMDSIIKKGHIDYEDIMDCFSEWCYNGKYTPFGETFDIGITTRKAMANYTTNPPLECGEKDFRDKTKPEVKEMINNLQNVSKVPILTAVDEEGGTVVRVSSNPNLASSKFESPRDLYLSGGFDKIRQDTINKSLLLSELGLNLNLAPVVDVSTNSGDYMYKRTLGENTELTSTYAKTVISVSKGLGVSYTLKHFPGYGNNSDTHTGQSIDNRSYDDIVKNDLPPFEAGINEGAEAVLVSHNTVTNIDSSNPASLSSDVHNILRNKLSFTGIVISDDLAMGAVSSIDNVAVKAITAGNDLLITTDYEESFNDIKEAVNNKTIDEGLIDKLAFRVLAWKYYKGLIFENQK